MQRSILIFLVVGWQLAGHTSPGKIHLAPLRVSEHIGMQAQPAAGGQTGTITPRSPNPAAQRAIRRPAIRQYAPAPPPSALSQLPTGEVPTDASAVAGSGISTNQVSAPKALPKVISSEEASNRLRMRRAETIKNLGVEVDWTEFNSSELLDIELRIRTAQAIQQLGFPAQWQYQTLDELENKRSRIEKAQTLEKQGVQVNWTRLTLQQLEDMEIRLKRAKRLQQLGILIDWERHSADELARLERQTFRNRARN